jgi:outer membrane protein assembly factor BamB
MLLIIIVMSTFTAACIPAIASSRDSGSRSPDSEWPLVGGDEKGTGFSGSAQVPGTNGILWTYDLGMSAGFSPVAADGKVFVGVDTGTSTGRMIAIDGERGEIDWEYDTGTGFTYETAAASNDMVFFKTDNHQSVVALNMSTGSEEWSADLAFEADAYITYSGDVLLLTGFDGIIALDMNDGHELWNFTNSTNMVSAPVVTGNTVLLYREDTMAEDFRIFGLNISDGQELWNFSTFDSVVGPVLAGETHVYTMEFNISRQDTRIHSYNLTSLLEEWYYTAPLPNWTFGGLAAGYGKIFVSVDQFPMKHNSSLVALNEDTGSEFWTLNFTDTYISLASVADNAVLFSNESALRVVSQIDGSPIWNMSLESVSGHRPTLAFDRIYILMSNGKIHCVGSGKIPVVEDVRVSDTGVTVGDSVTVTANYTNKGNTDADFEILDFFLNDTSTPIYTVTVNISAGGHNETSYVWDTSGYPAGMYRFTVRFRSGGEGADSPNITLQSPAAPNVYIASITTTPPNPVVGDSVTITATLKNNGTANATGVLVEFFQGAVYLGNETVDVPMGGSIVLATTLWDTSALTPGDYTIKATAGTVEKETTVTLLHFSDLIEIANVTCIPDHVGRGKTTTIKAKITYTGAGNPESIQVEFYDESYLLAIKIISINAGASVWVEFAWTVNDTAALGTHNISVVIGNSMGSTILTIEDTTVDEYYNITLKATAGEMYVGDVTTVTVSVTYLGPGTVENVTVHLREDNAYNIDEMTIPSISQNQTKDLVFMYTSTETGTHALTAYIDGFGNSNILLIRVIEKPSTQFRVDIQDPAENSEVKGKIQIRATIVNNDTITVLSVVFYVDGNKISEDLQHPYTASWDTTKWDNGWHKIKAVARTDLGINVSSKIISVNVVNKDGGAEIPVDTEVESSGWIGWLVFVIVLVLVIVLSFVVHTYSKKPPGDEKPVSRPRGGKRESREYPSRPERKRDRAYRR